MIRGAIAIVLALAGTAAASVREWTVKVPDGWTETPNAGVEQQVQQLRDIKSTVDVAATVYMAPDGLTQLTMLQWSTQHASTASGLELLNRGVMEGAKEQATKHVSDEAHFDGPQLVADQIDEINGVRVHQHRRFAIDLGGITHMVSAMCAGATTNASCEQAIAGMQLTVSGQVAPDPSPPKSAAYRIGQITGVVIVLLLVGLWLKTGGHIWRRPKKS